MPEARELSTKQTAGFAGCSEKTESEHGAGLGEHLSRSIQHSTLPFGTQPQSPSKPCELLTTRKELNSSNFNHMFLFEKEK